MTTRPQRTLLRWRDSIPFTFLRCPALRPRRKLRHCRLPCQPALYGRGNLLLLSPFHLESSRRLGQGGVCPVRGRTQVAWRYVSAGRRAADALAAAKCLLSLRRNSVSGMAFAIAGSLTPALGTGASPGHSVFRVEFYEEGCEPSGRPNEAQNR